jgi:hypothetical protein
VRLNLPGEAAGSQCVDMFNRKVRMPIAKDGALEIELASYEGRWFRIITGSTTELF